MTKLKSLNLQIDEFKKIEDVKISSSYDSGVIKYQIKAAVLLSYMAPESKLYVSFTINRRSKCFYHFRREVNTDNRRISECSGE